MIPRLHSRTHAPRAPLSKALGRPVSTDEGLTEHTVVAHWPGLDLFTEDDEQTLWTSAEWAGHLVDPQLQHPFAASPKDDRGAILHVEVRLHPDDRALTRPEWAEAALRLARAAGIEVPGDDRGCPWIAVQGQTQRLDLIANLNRLDGTWHDPPANVVKRLSAEARRLERDLHLIPVQTGSLLRSAARPLPPASAQLTSLLTQLTKEDVGLLPQVRRIVEHASLATDQLSPLADDSARRLDWVARRLYRLTEDVAEIASTLAPSASAPIGPPALRQTAATLPPSPAAPAGGRRSR
ncbi:relaxase/mobilization nuclease [Streptomyces sp. CA-294286]|uniref:relaxase/mobilization nuclease n=1 Tax=Streptomyces sp. CA-294286 TaxID=3240070 RepID=UPI003D8E50FD